MADSSFYYDPVDHMDQLRDVVVPVFAVRKGCNGERHPWHHWVPADCHHVDTATRLIFDNHEFVVYRFVSEEVARSNITKRLKKDPQKRFFIERCGSPPSPDKSISETTQIQASIGFPNVPNAVFQQ